MKILTVDARLRCDHKTGNVKIEASQGLVTVEGRPVLVYGDPEGKSIFSIEGHTDVEARPPSKAPAKTQLILPLKNVMFPVPGHYRVRININGNELAGPSMHLMRS